MEPKPFIDETRPVGGVRWGRSARGRRVSVGACRSVTAAFTLIELLVVVSIIALLVSILMPALGRAREQAKNTLCLTNLRSAASALVIYASNFNDHVPPARQHPDDGYFDEAHPFGKEHAVDWHFLLSWTAGEFDASDYSVPGADNDIYEDLEFKSESFMHCVKWPIFDNNAPSGFGGSFSFGYGMSMNMLQLDPSAKRFGQYATYYASPKLSSVRQPADWIYGGDSPHSLLHNYSWITNRDEWKDAIDGVQLPDGPLDHPAKPDDYGFHNRMHWSLCDPYRHLEGANYMFMDGHAEHLKAEEGYERYTRVQKNN